MVMDTNVVSELMRTTPSDVVLAWVRAQPATELCTTSVTVAEVRYGLARLPEGGRKNLLAMAAAEVFTAFADRILSFDAAAAAHYADVAVTRSLLGAPISGFDAQIAAICRRHGAALATRNISDFDRLGLDLVNPWREGEARSP